MPAVNGYDYSFEFYLDANEKSMNGMDFEEAAEKFKEHIRNETSCAYIGVDYKLLDGSEKRSNGYSLNLAGFENNDVKVISKDELGKLSRETLVSNKALEYLRNLKFDFDRANRKFESISSMFKRVDGESFDSCDFDFDILVTVDEIDTVNDPYDKYCKAVYDRVNVIRDDSDTSNLCCDWSEFIYRYYDKLKNFANQNWVKNNFANKDDFVYEWIKETKLLITGYGTDSIYKSLTELLENEPNPDNENYRLFFNDNIYPYMSAQTKAEKGLIKNGNVNQQGNSEEMDEELDLTNHSGLSR